MSLGTWQSLAFRGYVGTTLDIERDMSKLLVETEEISDGEEVSASGERDDELCEWVNMRPSVVAETLSWLRK